MTIQSATVWKNQIVTDRLLVAIDPGGTTGYSWADHDTGELMGTGQAEPLQFCAWLDELTGSWLERATIVCERFTITARTLKVSRGGSYDALEVIGVARYLSRTRCGSRDLIMSQPADVMRLLPDEKLKLMGWHQKGQGHANDSLRHLGIQLMREGVIRVPTS